VRVIDQKGQQVGILLVSEALKLAREAGLDLVEVAPRGDPPVCKIIDYGKWRYQQQKREQQSRKKQHTQELKELRIRPKTDRHDLEIKLNRAKEFLADGCKVQFTMMFRGRERLHREIAVEIFRDIVVQLEDFGKVERDGHFEGRRMIMILAPISKKSGEQKSSPQQRPAVKASEEAPAPQEVGRQETDSSAKSESSAEQGDRVEESGENDGV